MESVQRVLHGRVWSFLPWMSGSVLIWLAPYPAPDARTGTVDSHASTGHAILWRSVLSCPQNSSLCMLLTSIYRGFMLWSGGPVWSWWHDAVRKDSAVPGEGNNASTMALVHPLSSSWGPSDFNTAISIWSPPNIMTNLSSPYSGHSHWICFCRAYSGCSAAMTGSDLDWGRPLCPKSSSWYVWGLQRSEPGLEANSAVM